MAFSCDNLNLFGNRFFEKVAMKQLHLLHIFSDFRVNLKESKKYCWFWMVS